MTVSCVIEARQDRNGCRYDEERPIYPVCEDMQ